MNDGTSVFRGQQIFPVVEECGLTGQQIFRPNCKRKDQWILDGYCVASYGNKL